MRNLQKSTTQRLLCWVCLTPALSSTSPSTASSGWWSGKAPLAILHLITSSIHICWLFLPALALWFWLSWWSGPWTLIDRSFTLSKGKYWTLLLPIFCTFIRDSYRTVALHLALPLFLCIGPVYTLVTKKSSFKHTHNHHVFIWNMKQHLPAFVNSMSKSEYLDWFFQVQLQTHQYIFRIIYLPANFRKMFQAQSFKANLFRCTHCWQILEKLFSSGSEAIIFHCNDLCLADSISNQWIDSL